MHHTGNITAERAVPTTSSPPTRHHQTLTPTHSLACSHLRVLKVFAKSRARFVLALTTPLLDLLT